MNTKNDTVAWMGPDGSIILTCPEGWGIPSLVEQEPAPYYEFGEKEKICAWQLDQGQQPRWATSPPTLPRDGLQPLGEEWQVDSVTLSHGVTHTKHHRNGLLGESILETEYGQQLLRWHTKYTRNRSTWKTNPMGDPGSSSVQSGEMNISLSCPCSLMKTTRYPTSRHQMTTITSQFPPIRQGQHT